MCHNYIIQVLVKRMDELGLLGSWERLNVYATTFNLLVDTFDVHPFECAV